MYLIVGERKYTTINIRNDIIVEIDELVKKKPDGYKYGTRAGFITDAINLHIRRVRHSVKTGEFPEEYFKVYEK